MSSPKKAKPSEAEKATTEVAGKMYQTVAPLKDRAFNQFSFLAKNPGALAKRYAAKNMGDLMVSMHQKNKSTGGMGYNRLEQQFTQGLGNITQLAALIQEEAKNKAAVQSEAATASKGAIESEQQASSLIRGSKQGSMFTDMAIAEQQNKQDAQQQIMDQAAYQTGRVIGQMAYNKRSGGTLFKAGKGTA